MKTEELHIFTNKEFGNIRTIQVDGKPYFCGYDAAIMLGYKRHDNALKQHCHKDGALKQGVIDALGRTQQMTFINEGNLYRLIIKSKLPTAQKFEAWIFDEVLPTLRQTGAYFTPGREEEAINTYFPSFSDATKLQMVKDLQQKNQQLIGRNSDLQKTNKALAAGLLEWEDRTKLNKAVRRLAGVSRHYAGTIWNELYNQLLYKHGVLLRARGKAPYIQHVRENEWDKVIQSFSAICEAYGFTAADMFKTLEVQ